jgi:phage terminase small subunit
MATRKPARKPAKKKAPAKKVARSKSLAKPEAKLNDIEQRFVLEFLKDLNGTKAYLRVCPKVTPESARTLAARLFAKVGVQEAVAAAKAELAAELKMDSKRVLLEIARIATFDVAKLYDDDGKLKDISKIDDNTRAAIVGIEVEGVRTSKAGQTVKVKVADKGAALRMYAQHFALLKEHVEITGKDGGPIETRELSDAERAVRIANLVNAAMSRKPKK